ncbi:hypothetical protein [Streptomyces angustmyceticus]|uniref:hypothetical protein n=1 Tax=Streptomyces angustmyceticus TaxID=285578 RepID=UPI003D8F951B
MAALAHEEDRALVAALEQRDYRILRTDACPVLTSARQDSRAPHGFGAFLRRIAVDNTAPSGRHLRAAAPVNVTTPRFGVHPSGTRHSDQREISQEGES